MCFCWVFSRLLSRGDSAAAQLAKEPIFVMETGKQLFYPCTFPCFRLTLSAWAVHASW